MAIDYDYIGYGYSLVSLPLKRTRLEGCSILHTIKLESNEPLARWRESGDQAMLLTRAV